jgi:hypothetical protein
MNIAIIGAGSTGLIASYLASSLSLKAELFEATENIGGILRDREVNNFHFFSGCQYLNPESKWFELLPADGLYSFVHQYGSYTDIFDEVVVSKNFAGPTMINTVVTHLPQTHINESFSMSERLSFFPKIIELNLCKWLKNLGVDADKMHHEGLTTLAADRIFLSNQIGSVTDLRYKNTIASEFYGLPLLNHSRLESKMTLPRLGYTSYFDNEMLNDSKLKISKKTTVKIDFKENRFAIKTPNLKHDSFDNILWTGNPNPLLTAIGWDRLESFNLKCEVIVGYLNVQLTEPVYIQIYSKKTNMLRIFVYPMAGKSCFTVEKIDDGCDPKITLDHAKNILNKFDISASLTTASIFKQNRYILQTSKDYTNLLNLNNFLLSTNMVSGGWQKYSRDEKLQHISNHLIQLKDLK